MAVLTITQDDVYASFINLVEQFGFSTECGLPIEIIQGQANRVAEPTGDYIVYWPLWSTALSWPIDVDLDNKITASITNSVLTVSNVIAGGNTAVSVGSFVYPGTGSARILAALDDTCGGVGTYQLSNTSNVATTTMYTGLHTMTQPTERCIQCDLHGPLSADNAQILYTVWRDAYASTLAFEQAASIAPLYADEPRQTVFDNGEQQMEQRWSVDLHMQVNPTINLTQQFADQLVINIIEADSTNIL